MIMSTNHGLGARFNNKSAIDKNTTYQCGPNNPYRDKTSTNDGEINRRPIAGSGIQNSNETTWNGAIRYDAVIGL